MANIDLPGFIMTVAGTALLVFNIWWFLFPSVVVAYVSVQVSEVSALLDLGEPLPNEVKLRQSLAILNNRFIRLRTENHRSPGFFQQLGRMFYGLTCRLYVLRWNIDAFKREVELAIDAQQLATDAQQLAADAQQLATDGLELAIDELELAIGGLELAVLTATQKVAATVLPDPATNTAAPANDIAEPTPPPRTAAP